MKRKINANIECSLRIRILLRGWTCSPAGQARKGYEMDWQHLEAVQEIQTRDVATILGNIREMAKQHMEIVRHHP